MGCTWPNRTATSAIFWHDAHGAGFDGARFELPMEDGTVRTLFGPMRGDPTSVNSVFPELGGVVEASASEGAADFASGNSRCAVGITEQRAAEIHAQFPALALQQQDAIAEREQQVARFNARRQAEQEAER